jgi:hypothetical protein
MCPSAEAIISEIVGIGLGLRARGLRLLDHIGNSTRPAKRSPFLVSNWGGPAPWCRTNSSSPEQVDPALVLGREFEHPEPVSARPDCIADFVGW